MKQKQVLILASFFIILISLIGFSDFTLAQEIDHDALVPSSCRAGCPCTLCDLYSLGQNVIFFLLYIVAVPIAAISILYGGVLMLTSQGSEKKITQGKAAISNAVIGLALAFFAWLIIQALLQTLAFEINFGGALSNGLPWNEPPTCGVATSGSEAAKCNTTLPGNGGTNGGGGNNGGGAIDGDCVKDGFGICNPNQQGLFDGTACPDPGIGGEGCSWKQEPRNVQIYRDRLQDFEDEIALAAARYGIDPARLRAIIVAESSGLNSETHQDLDGQSSYGLMQIRPDTARALDPSLSGLSDAQIAQKLQDPAYNINLGAAYYDKLLDKYGNDETLASAAYNGGPSANEPSVNCPGLRRWQCGWDSNGCHNTGNTSCKPNTGYNPTRTYIDNINSMEPQLQ